MSIKLVVAIISTMTLLSGCAESQTMGNNIVSSMGTMVTEVVNGTVEGVRQGLSDISASNNKVAASSAPRSLSDDDMVYLFGWMEDACLADRAPYNSIKERESAFTDSFETYRKVTPKSEYDLSVEYIVKPRNQWMAQYQKLIKDIRVSANGSDITYQVIFNDNVKYRGQPLDRYDSSFTSDTEGSQQVLVFDPTANVDAIWTNFTSRKYSPHWASPGQFVDAGAKYNPQAKTITCDGN